MKYSNAKYEAAKKKASRTRKRSFYINAFEERGEFHIPDYQEFDYLFPQPEYADEELGKMVRA